MNAQQSVSQDILRGARALIDGGWTRGDDTYDKKGNVVKLDSPEARMFSLSGAVFRAGNDIKADFYTRDYAQAALRDAAGMNYREFNDAQTSSAPVLEVLDRAIHLLGTKPYSWWRP